MTIEADIVEALRTSQGTHAAILAEVVKSRAQNEALKLKIAALEAMAARLEAANVNVVEPAEVKPLIEALGHVLSEGYEVVLAGDEKEPPSDSTLDGPATPPSHGSRSSARGWA